MPARDRDVGDSARIVSAVARSMRARVGIRMVVRQIRADDDQRFRPAPQRIEHGSHIVGVAVADRQRTRARRCRAPTAGTAAAPRARARRRARCRRRRLASARLARWMAAASSATSPSGVAKRVRARGTARPRTGTRCVGPSRTTRVTTPRNGRGARTHAAATGPGIDVTSMRDDHRLRRRAFRVRRTGQKGTHLRRQAGSRFRDRSCRRRQRDARRASCRHHLAAACEPVRAVAAGHQVISLTSSAHRVP